MDFTQLKQSSISFYDLDKPESAISRWSRAKTRAAKVGKGLLKYSKAQKLALQHWLEAIDPRHRYGHNLHFYYVKWLQTQSKEPFFYWLDIGEGTEVNLEKCPLSKLQDQCIKYLSPEERKANEVVLQEGKFLWKQTGDAVDTTGKDCNAKWIFVLSTSKVLYIGKKKKGKFQHSSFLAGGATICAGRLVVEHGVLQAAWPHSGHYQPTEEHFKEFLSFLQEKYVHLSNVKTNVDEDEGYLSTKQRSNHDLRANSSDLFKFGSIETMYITDLTQELSSCAEQEASSSNQRNLTTLTEKIKQLRAPEPALNDDGYESETAEEEHSKFGKDYLAWKKKMHDIEITGPKEWIHKKVELCWKSSACSGVYSCSSALRKATSLPVCLGLS